MAKLDHLRAFLVSGLPELARNPESLLIYMTEGRLVARYAPANLGFEYRAQLAVDVLGFPGEPAQFFLPFLLWVRRHEPSALQNHDTGEQQLRFEIDVLDNGAVDISIQMPMTEAVDVLPRVDGSGYDMTLREEPDWLGDDLLTDPAALLKRIYRQDGTLLAGTPLP